MLSDKLIRQTPEVILDEAYRDLTRKGVLRTKTRKALLTVITGLISGSPKTSVKPQIDLAAEGGLNAVKFFADKCLGDRWSWTISGSKDNWAVSAVDTMERLRTAEASGSNYGKIWLAVVLDAVRKEHFPADTDMMPREKSA